MNLTCTVLTELNTQYWLIDCAVDPVEAEQGGALQAGRVQGPRAPGQHEEAYTLPPTGYLSCI